MKIEKLFASRLGRKHYLIAMLLIAIPIYLLVGLPAGSIMGSSNMGKAVASLVLVPFAMVLIVRRFHDVGISGKPYIIYTLFGTTISLVVLLFPQAILFPHVYSILSVLDKGNLAIGVFVLFANGQKGKNRFGHPTSHLPLKSALFHFRNTENSLENSVMDMHTKDEI